MGVYFERNSSSGQIQPRVIPIEYKNPGVSTSEIVHIEAEAVTLVQREKERVESELQKSMPLKNPSIERKREEKIVARYQRGSSRHQQLKHVS